MTELYAPLVAWTVVSAFILALFLRFSNDVQVRRAIKALEERTSHRVELVVERRDAR